MSDWTLSCWCGFCSSTKKLVQLRLSPALLLSSLCIQGKGFIWDTPWNPVYFVLYWVASSSGHMSFKQETRIYLANSSFWKQIFGASNPAPLFPSRPLLLISQRKEFYSTAQTFLCIFLRRSLNIALAAALQEEEITLCSHSSLLPRLNIYFSAGQETYMCYCFLGTSLICVIAKTFTRQGCGWMRLQLLHNS